MGEAAALGLKWLRRRAPLQKSEYAGFWALGQAIEKASIRIACFQFHSPEREHRLLLKKDRLRIG